MHPNLTIQIEKLTSIGISLSSERNHIKLMEKILLGAKELTNADGGTLYRVEDNCLVFEILRTDSLNLAMGGTSSNKIKFSPIPLYLENGEPNSKNVSAYAAVSGETINIPDAYKAEGFDFQGTKRYDEANKYRSKSFLAVPLKNHENKIVGILQLLNALDPHSGEVIPFSLEQQKLAESMASQAAIAITNQQLLDDVRNLLEKFIEVIASAIDEKSPYTGGHCRRVPTIARLLADAVNNNRTGALKDINFNDKELYELNIAALLHDCGKITTPVHIVDKATKLETIFDRLEIIKLRLTNLKKDKKIALHEALLQEKNPVIIEALQARYLQSLQQINEDLDFLQHANKGSEFMKAEDKIRIEHIAEYEWIDFEGKRQKVLKDDEIANLCIEKGTLTTEERKIINNHIVMTQKMLDVLPFPDHLKNVPEIAGNHHERMDGKGYPNAISGKDLSIRARIMCIADVFEALTAADRPYKKAMPLSQTLKILEKMKEEGHIDPDLFQIFIEQEIFQKYAQDYLTPEQNDLDLPFSQSSELQKRAAS